MTIIAQHPPSVRYGYSEMSYAGSAANHSRLVYTVYPNGRELDYAYAPGVDNKVSRLSFVSEPSTATYSGMNVYALRGGDVSTMILNP